MPTFCDVRRIMPSKVPLCFRSEGEGESPSLLGERTRSGRESLAGLTLRSLLLRGDAEMNELLSPPSVRGCEGPPSLKM